MNNIWKFSLFSAFFVIADQLFKGTLQTVLVNTQDKIQFWRSFFLVRKENFSLIAGISLWPGYDNQLAIVALTLGMGITLFYIVKKRNKNIPLCWGLSFLFSAFLTTWLDRFGQGYATNTFLIGHQFGFNAGHLLTFFGMILVLLFRNKAKECE